MAKASGTVRIRAARATDARAVRALCARIWSDDYIPRSFSDWVRDRRGRLWVATLDGRVVGVAKLTLLGQREGWLHGLRVDPRYRRRGVATALLDHRLRRAERFGARTVRLDTQEDNVAVRRLMRRFGFAEIARYGLFSCRAAGGTPPRLAGPGELTEIWALNATGDLLLHTGRIVCALRRSDVATAIGEGCCVVTDTRAGIRAAAIVEAEGDLLRVRWLAGRGRALGSLLRGLPALARERGLARVASMLPRSAWSAAKAAGYRQPWDDAMLIYERRLRPGRAWRGS